MGKLFGRLALTIVVPQKNYSEIFQLQGRPVYHIKAGLHTFEFSPSTVAPGGMKFVQKEEYSGLLAFLMSPWLAGKKIMGQFDKFNADLKTSVLHSTHGPCHSWKSFPSMDSKDFTNGMHQVWQARVISRKPSLVCDLSSN